MNARFWQFINSSWVKITLKPGQSLSWYCREAHEEGYSFEGITWEHTGSFILRQGASGGRDCDGYLQNDYENSCHVTALRVLPAMSLDANKEFEAHDGAPIMVPDWKHVDSRVFDEYAQAAGY